MQPAVIRTLAALVTAAFGTTLPWVVLNGGGFSGLSLSGQALSGDWVMICALVAGGMLVYWDRTGRIVPERLLIARVSAGLAVAVTLNDLWDIVRTPEASMRWGWFVTAAGAIAAFALMARVERT